MGNVLLISLGGGIGSILRYLIGGVVQSLVPASTFPYGTFIVNVTGCFFIGVLAQVSESQGALSAGARAFLIVGLLGGYTTFSSFANETVNLMRDGERLASAMNVGGQLVLAIGAVWLGRLIGYLIWR